MNPVQRKSKSQSKMRRSHQALRAIGYVTCPNCGKVYISKDLAEGRMCEVEQTLEDK